MCILFVHAFPLGKMERTLETTNAIHDERLNRWNIQRIFSRRYFSIRSIRRNGSGADVADLCISRLLHNLQRHLLPESRVFSGPSVCRRRICCEMRECEMPNTASRIAASEWAMQGWILGNQRSRIPLLILQETVQYIHLLTPRQRGWRDATSSNWIFRFVYNRWKVHRSTLRFPASGMYISIKFLIIPSRILGLHISKTLKMEKIK